MQALLAQLNEVPGVVGTMLCDADGSLLAQAFPPTFEPTRLRDAAAVLADRTSALETALGDVGVVDFRFAGARIVVKAVDRARLLFLCAPTINVQLLAMSAAAAVRSLERLAAEPAAPAAPSGALYRLAQRIEALVARAGGDRFRLRGQIALKAGFSLDLVDAATPDDPVRLEKLRAAASAVLGQQL